jgi:putative transcriptional regulator
MPARTTTKRKSRILAEMHETARGLHGAGLISRQRIGEFDALCRADVQKTSPQHVKSQREQAHLIPVRVSIKKNRSG